MEHEAKPCGCTRDIGSSKAHIPQTCKHGNLLRYTKAFDSKPRKPLRRVSEKREREVRRRGSTLKQGRGFAVTKAQREKVRGLPCVNCGREASEYVAIDPGHLSKRGSQGGCDHVLCVVPICRDINGGCHVPFDKGELDIYHRPRTKAEALEMAQRWGTEWSHWNSHAVQIDPSEPGDRRRARVDAAQHDAAEVQRLAALHSMLPDVVGPTGDGGQQR